MTAQFPIAFQRSMGFEGKVYSSTPGDPGGPTFWGISRVFNPTWPGWATLDSEGQNSAKLPQMAADYYQEKIWTPHLIGDLNSQLLANQLFDSIINPGPVTVEVFQGLVGVKADGFIGPASIKSANAADQDELLKDLITWRTNHYGWLVSQHPETAVNLAGWLSRCVAS